MDCRRLQPVGGSRSSQWSSAANRRQGVPAREWGHPMAAIEASCALCGAVLVSPRDIVVRVCVDLKSSSYIIRCPGCGLRAAKPANDDVVDILTSIGASVEEWYLPTELSEPRPGGAAI